MKKLNGKKLAKSLKKVKPKLKKVWKVTKPKLKKAQKISRKYGSNIQFYFQENQRQMRDLAKGIK